MIRQCLLNTFSHLIRFALGYHLISTLLTKMRCAFVGILRNIYAVLTQSWDNWAAVVQSHAQECLKITADAI